jgi:effector-binding domain-containing protein
MLGAPRADRRDDQPYVAIKAFVTMETLGSVLPPLHPQLRAWLEAQDLAPAGAPFFKYNVIDMARELEVEVGFPLAHTVAGDERVLAGVLPGGEYATVLYTGHPAGLIDATRDLLEWADSQGLKWDVSATPQGDRWGSRLEIYVTDGPDMDKWETQLAFRLAG